MSRKRREPKHNSPAAATEAAQPDAADVQTAEPSSSSGADALAGGSEVMEPASRDAEDAGAESDAAGEGNEAFDDVDDEIVLHDADAEDLAERMAALAREQRERATDRDGAGGEGDEGIAPGGQPRSMAELMGIIEALVFVAEEPISAKVLAEVLREERGWVEVAVQELAKEFNERNAGLMLREVAGGWQFATRAEHHEHVRAFLKSRPSAKLSLAALETLAVIAYKQPVTIPEILEIRGVQSSSAIKTLLDKRLIVAKGRKEVIGRPMMYGTSKDFMMQFGLKDLSELPNFEDFEDLTGGGA
ncbi:MAG: SMC-Scp complex subunit ScpB [Acidobacteria bacterium]|nr:SMC-Scp complex subunit ScpB [Acidobacteriota bacterium]MCA1643409.1 SMC-Scp complex subunit ScpB [Acidobacteriota bacterium]